MTRYRARVREKVRQYGFRMWEAVTRKFNVYRGMQSDPNTNPAERYYARVYRSFLARDLDGLYDGETSRRILDVGCGTGRFAVDLASRGHEVTALDYMPDAIEMAKRKAEARGVSLNLKCGEAREVLAQLPDGGFDVILCFEMLYVTPRYRELLAEMRRLLDPGGILACSHRSKHYFVVTLLNKGDYRSALRVARTSEGLVSLNDVPVYYNWQTTAELEDLYEELGLHLVDLHPIGMFSGFGVDGMSAIANPEVIGDAEREVLFELETEDLEDYVGAGRYTLAVARKP